MQSKVNDGVAASVADVNSNWTDWILGAPESEILASIIIIPTKQLSVYTLVAISVYSNKNTSVGCTCIRDATAVDSSW